MLITTMIAAALLGAAPAKVEDCFQTCEYRYGERKELAVSYHLFVPHDMTPGKRYPLLVWMYHAGDVPAGFLAFLLKDLDHLEKYEFFIAAIHYPSSDPSWFHTVGAREYHEADAAIVVEIVASLVREHPIDDKRVCLSGASAGGGRCWEVALRRPDVFSAVVPCSSGTNESNLAEKLRDVRIWAFHNSVDGGSPLERVQVMVAATQAAGGYAQLTVVPHPGHDSWLTAYGECDILTWMFAQRRGSWACWVPPNTVPWQWRHILAEPCIFFGIVGVGWYLERNRRRCRKRHAIMSQQFGCLPGPNDFPFGIGW